MVARLQAVSGRAPTQAAGLPRGRAAELPADWPAPPWDLDAWPDHPPSLADWPSRPDPASATRPAPERPEVSAPRNVAAAPAWAPPLTLAEHVRSALQARLPAPLQGARWDPGRRGAYVLAVLGLLAAIVAVAFALHGRAHPVSAPVPAVRATVPAPADDPLAAGVTVQVDVEGKVARPGLVTLPSGARIAQALTAAGGALPGTDTAALDLAAKVTDGQQLRVGLGGAAPPAAGSMPAGRAAAGGAGALVDLNTATADQLDALPHVGPATAARILAWRTVHGPFSAVSQLQQVSGIGPSTYQDIAALVTV